ncbi:MAG: DUF305 domain-containing protein [bacterium]|nr:DUF305 domain-containing protein [bacterium]
MSKEIIISGVAGIIIGIFVAPLFLPAMPWAGQMMYRDSMMGSGDFAEGIDAHFIEQMIPHHEDAIIMANLASTRAEHLEIKELATGIIRTQSEEIDQMEQWYASWFGKEVPNVSFSMGHGMGMMMHSGMMGNETDIGTLENADVFDKEFIEQMIPHHQMAVMMAQMLLRSSDRPEMEQLAKNIIEAQTREINSMREWYSQWYAN